MESILLLIKEDTKSATSKRIMKIDIILERLNMKSYHPLPDQTLSDILNPAEYKFEYLIVNIEFDDINNLLLKCKSLYPNIGILLIYDKNKDGYEKNLNELVSTHGIKNSLEKNNITLNALPDVLKQIKRHSLVQSKTVEKYVFMQNINSGAQGVVDLVFCSKTKQYLARKKIKIEGMSNKEKIKVKEEENRMKEIRVPTVVNFFDSSVDNDHRYIYMEYADAGSLENLKNANKLKGTNISNDLILDWMIEIMIALFVLNKHSIIHRDIKAENILLKKEIVGNKEILVAKLIDLGISRQNVEGFDFTLCGTPFYLCPEIATGLTRYDYNVDLWSLGIVVYEMLTLRKPFGDPSDEAHKDAGVSELYLSIRLDNYPKLPEEIHPKFHYLIRQMLKKNPKKRFILTDLFKLDFVYDRFIELVNTFEWKNKIPFIDDLLSLSKTKVGCYETISIINEEDIKILKDAHIFSENVNYTTYRRSIFGLSKKNVIIGQELLDCFELLKEDLNYSKLTEKEYFTLLLTREVIVPISHPDTEVNSTVENLLDDPSSTYYKFSFDPIDSESNNQMILKDPELKPHYNLIDLSQCILDKGKKLIKALNKTIETKQDLIINSRYYEFIVGLGCFRNFSLFDLPNEEENRSRLVFLLNLYQIMIIHSALQVFMGVDITKKDVVINYAFQDITLNNMELKHIIFRNNKKPPGYYFRLVYDSDIKNDLLPDFNDGRPLLILPDINLNFCNDLINYKTFFFKIFNCIKSIDFQLEMLVIKFMAYYLNCYEDKIEFPIFIKNYVHDFGSSDTPERPKGLLKIISLSYNKNKEEGIPFYIINEKTKEQENLEIFANFTLLLKKLKNLNIEYY